MIISYAWTLEQRHHRAQRKQRRSTQFKLSRLLRLTPLSWFSFNTTVLGNTSSLKSCKIDCYYFSSQSGVNDKTSSLKTHSEHKLRSSRLCSRQNSTPIEGTRSNDQLDWFITSKSKRRRNRLQKKWYLLHTKKMMTRIITLKLRNSQSEVVPFGTTSDLNLNSTTSAPPSSEESHGDEKTVW